MSLIPIILMHKGDTSYLKYTLSKLRFSNHNNAIYLLGDETNHKYENFVISKFSLKNYLSDSKGFDTNYIHRSSYNYNYELL